MLALIGSRAVNHHAVLRASKDYDFVGTMEDVLSFIRSLSDVCYSCPSHEGKKWLVKTRNLVTKEQNFYEFEIAWSESNSEHLLDLIKQDPHTVIIDNLYVPSLNTLYMLKMSHRYLKDSVHFNKTMDDIVLMRGLGAFIEDGHKAFLKEREKATYNYSHPSLKKNKDNFFSNDGVNYIYDHDWIHTVVKHKELPAYEYFKADKSEVFCDKDLFFRLDKETQLYAVLEESYVLALERSQIPFKEKADPKKSFDIALMKICTSITSGWFREFAWENYHIVQSLYDNDYVDRFWQAEANYQTNFKI
jgi:hypothetical protein